MRLISGLFLLGLSLSTPVPANTELKSNNILDGTPSRSIKPIEPKYKIESVSSNSGNASPSSNGKIMFSNSQEVLNHEKKHQVEYEGKQYLLRV